MTDNDIVLTLELAEIRDRAELVAQILRSGQPLTDALPGVTTVIGDIRRAADRALAIVDPPNGGAR